MKQLLMQRLLTLCFTTLFCSSCLASGYTLLTFATPSEKDAVTTTDFFIDLLNEMFGRADIPLRTKQEPWIRSQQKVISASPNEHLLIAPLTRTAEREDHYDWVVRLAEYRLQFVSNDKTLNLNNIDTLKAVPVCVLRSSPAETTLRELGFTSIRANVFEQRCYQDMREGKIRLVFSHGNISAEVTYVNLGGKSEDLIFGGEFPEQAVYLAGTRNAMAPEDREKLVQALEMLKKDGTYDRISARFVSH
jgi:polar amino acid transport system substrate-binding protein